MVGVGAGEEVAHGPGDHEARWAVSFLLPDLWSAGDHDPDLTLAQGEDWCAPPKSRELGGGRGLRVSFPAAPVRGFAL